MINIEHYKEKLLIEKSILEDEIESLGTIESSPSHFEVKERESISSAEEMSVADSFEISETKDAILEQLENRLLDVLRALLKIDANTYGVCEISGEEIEEDRLEANPAARTNKANREVSLEGAV
jgi:RNA polymerase-binding transcription factor DksA